MKALLFALFLISTSVQADTAADGQCSANPLTYPFLQATGTSLENLDQMHPMGNTASNHVIPAAHFYLYLDRLIPGDYTSPSVETTLHSPGVARVVAVTRGEEDHGSGTINAYQVTLKICANTYLYIGHLTELSPAIQSVVGTVGAPGCETSGVCYWLEGGSTPLDLVAGDELGKTKSTHALDIGAFNVTYSAPFISPSFYDPDYAALTSLFSLTTAQAKILLPSKSYRKCALDYFTTAAANLLLAYNPRTASPRCGDFAQDMVGRAKGSWLPLAWYGTLPRTYGADSEEDSAISLSHDFIDPSYPLLSVGNNIPLTDNTGNTQIGTLAYGDYYYDFYSAPTSYWDRENWNFADIPVGNEVYCFQDLRSQITGSPVVKRIILVQMRTQTVAGVSKTVLRVQARKTYNCPDVNNRNLDNPRVAEFFRD